jgi:hypothetical protein
MTCDEPVDDKEDEKGHSEGPYALAGKDDDRSVEKVAIDLVERGIDRKNAQLLLGAVKGMKDRKFAVHIRVGLAGASADHHGIGVIGGLAHFDEADVRQVKNPVDLQLELARVKVPESFAEATTITPFDLGYPAIDRDDVTAILEVKLQRCKQQSDR